MIDSDEIYVSPNPFLANIRRIENILLTHGGSSDKCFAHLVEEIGEIASCLRGKKVEEPITIECLDAINCLTELYFLSGGKLEEYANLQSKKLNKWESKIAKRKSNEQRT